MSYTEIITLITGILVVGILTIIYVFYKIRKFKIIKFIIKGNKEIKRLHYILKCNRFKIINVNKNFKYKIYINNEVQKFNFRVVALARKKKKKYACFIHQYLQESLDYEMLFKIKVTKCKRSLIINPELFELQVFKLK